MPNEERMVVPSEGQNAPVKRFEGERRSGFCRLQGDPKTKSDASSLSIGRRAHHSIEGGHLTALNAVFYTQAPCVFKVKCTKAGGAEARSPVI